MAPQGGSIDKTPPKLLSIAPNDSLLNNKPRKIELRFDEYITVSDVASNVQIAPLLPIPLTVEGLNKKVTVKIPDSLLTENTTYRISFGSAIKDLNEGNAFPAYSYIFSTGSYFDSLRLSGTLIDAATGMNEKDAVVVLYDAKKSDSIVVREKPMYVAKANDNGHFSFEGLPNRSFKIFAIGDANKNLMYDGGEERVGFADELVIPNDSNQVKLYVFKQKDTATKKITAGTEDKNGRLNTPSVQKNNSSQTTNPYQVVLDTSNIKKRSFDITTPIHVQFNAPIKTLNDQRINLSMASAGVNVEALISVSLDTARHEATLNTKHWQGNSVYTLRLLKGFAQDTSGKDLMPSKYTFRTKQEEDYGKLHIHLPSKYSNSNYVFVLLRDNDSVYQKVVTDTILHFTYLQPGSYTLRIIVDKNKNGIWDTGNLLGRKQPELVIPYPEKINLKAGWENMVDFEQKPIGKDRASSSPQMR